MTRTFSCMMGPTLAVLFSVAAAAHPVSGQVAQPPPVTQAEQVQTSSTPPPPPPPARGPVTREQQALQDALKIQDPDQKLAALRKVQKDLDTSVAVFVIRQVDDAILSHLATNFRDRRDEIAQAFDRVRRAIAPATPADQRLATLTNTVTRLVDSKVFIQDAEKALRTALDELDPERYAREQREMAQRAKRPEPAAADIEARFNTMRSRAIETLGRMHLESGDVERAEREFKEALSFNPSLARAPIALAEIEARRGNDRAALDYYMLAALGGRLKSAEEKTFRALYSKVHGSESGLEAALDKAYAEKFPNPVTPQPYVPSAERTNRVVLLELFTGSACPPCVSADLAFDALLERYPADAIAPLAYHAHIPGPDPMVIPGSDARRTYYAVRGVPTFNVDGALGRIGGGARDNTPRTYADYIAAIDKGLATPATATVRVHGVIEGSRVTVTATASNLPAGAADLRLHVVLAERHLGFGGENGIRHHAMVVRGVGGENGSGSPIIGSADTTIQLTFDLSVIRDELVKSLSDEIAKRRKTETPGPEPREYRAEGRATTDIDPTQLVLIAFVQDGSKKVLQAARADVLDQRRK